MGFFCLVSGAQIAGVAAAVATTEAVREGAYGGHGPLEYVTRPLDNPPPTILEEANRLFGHKNTPRKRGR